MAWIPAVAGLAASIKQQNNPTQIASPTKDYTSGALATGVGSGLGSGAVNGTLGGFGAAQGGADSTPSEEPESTPSDESAGSGVGTLGWLQMAGQLAGAAAAANRHNSVATQTKEYNSRLPTGDVNSILSGIGHASQPFPGGSGDAGVPSLGSARDYAIYHNLAQLNSGIRSEE